jgi:hypothetical protein
VREIGLRKSVGARRQRSENKTKHSRPKHTPASTRTLSIRREARTAGIHCTRPIALSSMHLDSIHVRNGVIRPS